MIDNPKILKLRGKDVISFNDGEQSVVINNGISYRISYNAKILGILRGNLILLIKNKFIVSADFLSLTLNKTLYKGSIDAHTCSDSAVWFLHRNKVYSIDVSLQVFLYDDFTHVRLVKIEYLRSLATLAFTVKDEKSLKIHFESTTLPTLSFSDVSLIPEISFESKYGIILSIGRSILEYDIQHRQLKILKNTNPIKLKWDSTFFSLHYKIISTELAVGEEKSRIYKIDGDVWKVVNTGNDIYLFSDSINSPISVNKIDSEGNLSRIYRLKRRGFSMQLENHNGVKSSPLLRLISHSKSSKNTASSVVFFIHGGPHQKAGNMWDPLLRAFLRQKYPVYVPQYPGTLGVEGLDDDHAANYGTADFEDLVFHYDQLRQTHQRVILVGHSYGAFLGLKLFLKRNVDILVGINGVYDLLTISSINPKTYAHLDEQEKISRSPNCLQASSNKRGQWHHIQFEHDPLIRLADLKESINKVGGNGPMVHYLNFDGHGAFNTLQSSLIVGLIQKIEHQYYNHPNLESYEPIYC